MPVRVPPRPVDEAQRRRSIEASRAAYQARLEQERRIAIAALGLALVALSVAVLALVRAFGG